MAGQTTVLNLCCIVEGKGDVSALRVLIERLSEESNGGFWVNLVKNPLRTSKHRLIRQDDDTELRKKISLAALNLEGISTPRGILILIDADDDCPAKLGPELLNRARHLRSDIPMSVVVAKSEYESWLLAGIEGLEGNHGFPEELSPINDPELIRNGKGKLGELRSSHGVYKPTADQASLTSSFDLAKARERSASFSRFCRQISSLLEQ